MKRFIYTYTCGKPARGTCNYPYTVKIYQVKRDEVKHLVTKTETYVSEFQLVMMALEQHKLLPRKAFERNSVGGYKFGGAHLLKEAGFALVHGV